VDFRFIIKGKGQALAGSKTLKWGETSEALFEKGQPFRNEVAS
jgi:hypothetical protein